uniref:glutathione transferase n=1 Tax=Tamarix hispida TaxID=189793 RepID=S5TCC2_9CARY|nr:glutathione S-transferase [Tamarix hispida]
MEETPKSGMKLYSYWKSTCACRVRIALNLKGLKYEYKAVDLLKGEHHSPEFSELNPLGFVPVLVDEDIVLADSFAILMYMEEKYPERPLLPQELQRRAINYQAANIVSSSIQPHQNLTLLNYIEEKLGAEEMYLWAQNQIKKGFSALEKLLSNHAGRYATGDDIALADVFLAPQTDAAIKTYNINMDEFPLLKRLNHMYGETPAFQDAMPEKQPDSPDNVK